MLSRLRALPALALGLVAAAALSGCSAPSTLIRGVGNPFSYGICGLIVIVLDILAIVELWKSSRSDGDKLLWTLLIVIFPVLGLALYYLFGKR